ncbi:hypothetical protein IGB42_01471 [Andreprevotia sp. IGB-42]|uniref:ApeP family dehydratase n=1 Tax=Andreprevotia sp. IGB-42 TaxID=2497473 RepID=UPI00135869F9|nr:hotdog family protein [Andreprevotia sp. IGB-42]KAF0813792.1 hypothetical protein IGB42_01471 [Andreprevotia sp. IGB-42]
MIMPTYLPMADYVPHSGRMVLLDRVCAASANAMTTEVTIRTDSPFIENDAVGSWVGIEYMAQTIAALAGWEARERGDSVKVGFLVGTRRYDSKVPAFTLGSVLTITAIREFQADNGVAVMDCRISAPDGQTLVEAQISVFQPDDLHDYLKQAH